MDQDVDPGEYVFAPLAQWGPGSDASTLRALAALPAVPAAGCVLDLGCGPGRQTLALARATRANVIAVDVDAGALGRLADRAELAGLGDRIAVREASMLSPDVPVQSVDLIWSEGAVYIVGISAALTRWSPLLRPGGAVAFTDAVWLTDAPPEEIHDWWTREYPAMGTVAGVAELCRVAGYRVVDTQILPAEDWTAGYYDPLAERVETLRAHAESWPDLADLLDELATEIDLRRRYAETYGYAFFLLQHAG